jgi:hypothetical protein
MEKRSNKIFVITILSLFLIAFSMQFVVAENVGGKLVKAVTPGGWNTGAISDALSSFTESDGFAKFLIFILVTLIIYGISDSFMEGKSVLRFGVSLIIGILSTFYLVNTEVRSILLSYGALGITLSLIIPFVIIVIMGRKLSTEGKVPFASKVLWLGFGIILIMRWWTAPTNEIGAFGIIIYPVIALATLIMLIWDRRLYAFFMKEETAAELEKFRDKARRARAAREELAKDVKGGE